MTPEQAELLAEHAAQVWPDVLVSVWSARLIGLDFVGTRAVLAALRVADRRGVTLAEVVEAVQAREAARRAPCAVCGGSGFVTVEQEPVVRFETDQVERPVTVIIEPEIPLGADAVVAARAWAEAIRRGREAGVVEVRRRQVPVTKRCPECSAITKEPAA